jgi:type I restriction enzyme M protein
MITGEFKSRAESMWDAMWSGGISNPHSVIEQLAYVSWGVSNREPIIGCV